MLPTWSRGAVFPIEVFDFRHNRLRISEKPQRVVSLAPYISEMLLALGREKILVGLTRQDLTLNSALRKMNVGGYSCPDIEAIDHCRPDLIIASPCHNVMVVRGEGPVEKYAGGHTKLGELISRAVYKGVQEAIFKQKGLRADRDLFQRLADRKLRLERIVRMYPVKGDKKMLTQKLEELLMTPFYASFLETALAVSDEYRKGLIKELAFFDVMCCSVAARLSGRRNVAARDIPTADALPPVISRTFGALVLDITEKDD